MANGLTVGSLSLLSTFRCISVKASFSGDDNANATASVEFKRAASGIWRQAITPIIDRRTTINGSANTYVNQARGSIVGLLPNTEYDVRVTWTDSDGITGSNPVTGSVSTLTYDPPTGGSTVHVGSGQTYSTIAAAEAATSAGDTIVVHDNVSAGTTLTTSGTSGAYRVLQANTAGVTLGSGSPTTALTISGNYWRILGFAYGPTTGSPIVITDGNHHHYIEDATGTDVATGATGENYYGAIYGAKDNAYVLRANFTCTKNTTASGPFVDGVFLGDPATTVVVEECTFAGVAGAGGFWDAVGNGNNNGIANMENCDIGPGNSFTEYHDDGLEIDGGGINVRVWGHYNATTSAAGGSGVAMSAGPIWTGPTYVFRSVFRPSASTSYGLKLGDSAGQITKFFFHCVFDTSGSAGGGHETTNFSNTAMFRNCIFKAAGNIHYNAQSAFFDADYNLAFQTVGADYAGNWNGATNYSDLAAFQAGTGHEAHGLVGNPLLYSDGRVGRSSPALDAGVAIPNFNSADSAWPHFGSAPDIGAFEFRGKRKMAR